METVAATDNSGKTRSEHMWQPLSFCQDPEGLELEVMMMCNHTL